MVSEQEIEQMSDDQLRHLAMGILSRELGLYGYARFLMVYRPGTGDYTRDRHLWQDDLKVDDVIADIRKAATLPG